MVARGAAVFASTVALDQPLAAPIAGEFTAELTYPRTTSLVDVPVAGRFHSAVDQDWTRYKVVIGNPKGNRRSPRRRSPWTAGAPSSPRSKWTS